MTDPAAPRRITATPASSSATPAPRRTRRRSRSLAGPGGRTSSPRARPFTAAPWVRSRSPGSRPSARPFEPLPAGVSHIPYGDVAALDAAVDTDTAAVVLEPILGEAGVIVPPEGYLTTAREITAARGALLVLDEVQTGIGRTGAWFAHQTRRDHPGRRHAGEGPRRRPADRSVHRHRPGRHAARTGTARHAPSAATRSAAPRRSPCSTRSPRRACSSTSGRSVRRSRRASTRWGTRWSRGDGGRAADRCRTRRARLCCGGRGRPRRWLPGQQRRPRPDPADPAAGPDRGAGAGVPRRAARVPRRRQGGSGSAADAPLPARRRPHSGRAACRPRPRRTS